MSNNRSTREARKRLLSPGRRSTASLAASAIGITASGSDLRNMVKALRLHPWNNTRAEEERLVLALWALQNWSAFQAECNRRRGGR